MLPGRKNLKQNSVTLLELAISMVILSVVILTISQLDIFSHTNVISAQRQMRVANEASLALEHIAMHLNPAIGDAANHAADNTPIGGDVALRFWIDDPTNPNFQRDGTDISRAYRWTGLLGSNAFLLRYCDSCGNPTCTQCSGTNSCGGGSPACWGVVVARDVVYFGKPQDLVPAGPGAVALQDNFASIELRVCHNVAAPCGTPNNPQVSMQENIKMPSFSTR
jgi:Tfp pilus assembly protein PilV